MPNTGATRWRGLPALVVAIVCTAMARIPPDAAAIARKVTGGGGAVAAELAGTFFDLAASTAPLLGCGPLLVA